jgi:hypothetical protein
MATEVAAVPHFLRGAMHRRGVDAMNLRLFAQSLVFVTAALILTAVLAIVLRLEIARLLFAVGVAGICLIAEIYVAIKVALGLWEWSGGLAGTIVRQISARHDRKIAASANRGEA